MIRKILGAGMLILGCAMLVLSGIVRGGRAQLFFFVTGPLLIYFGLKQLTYI